jgi:uncharacterized membrane protein
MTARTRSRIVLAVSLFALAALFTLWFHDDRHRLAALLVFTLPPLLALAAVLRGGTTASRGGFWAGVLGLFWFSHGVMVAWSHAADAGWGWGEIGLSLAIIGAGSWPGMRARFGR